MRFSITRAAQADIDEVWVSMATASGMDYANRVRDSLFKTFLLLLRVPYAGRNREFDMSPGLRSIPSGKLVVFYRAELDYVRIVRVIHGSRDARAILSDE